MKQVPVESFRAADLVNMDVEEAFAKIVRYAADVYASDICFLADQRCMNISLRQLGMVHNLAYISVEQGRHLLSFVKANAEMDIAERRHPADGR